MNDKEYTYSIDKYTIGVDTNGEDGIGMTVAKIENGELHFLGNCYGENARCIDLLIKENQELKQKLNWIAFGDDAELALRYLRKIGYVDFDEERKVYINKHNNEPFVLDDEEEKAYYIKSEELNEYTEQLEYQNKKLKKQLEQYQEEVCILDMRTDENIKYKNQQKEFIKYLEDESKEIYRDGGLRQNIFRQILQKYKEITGEIK
jgi:hypothetical protein